MSDKKKIDMLIWLKGIDEDSEGDVLKNAVGLKKYTDDIVVVAGPPEKLLALEARRELLEDSYDDDVEWDDEDSHNDDDEWEDESLDDDEDED